MFLFEFKLLLYTGFTYIQYLQHTDTAGGGGGDDDDSCCDW